MRRRLLLLAPALLAAAPFDPFDEARIVDRPGAQVPLDARFTDQDGRATTLRRVAAGRPILLAPVLHDCPNICGVTLAGLSDAIAGQASRPGRDVALVAFGIDPAETAADAAADLERLERRRPLEATALVGDAAAVRAVTDALGYRYAYDPRIGQYAHLAATAVLTPDGRLVRWLNGIAPEPAALASAIADARQEKTGGLGDAIALLCFH